MASHHHLLLTQLLGHVLGAGAGHVDPGLAEEDAGAEYEGEVEDGVDQVHQHRAQRLGMRKVVVEIADGVSAAAASIAPDAEQVDDEVARLDDRDVVGVEQLDVVASVLAAVPDRLDWQVDAKTRK